MNLSLDDFGTGFSSLSLLKQLPVDEMKIDKSFIDALQSDFRSLQMVKNIISIARNYGMSIVAEGVEEEEQENLLWDLGCDRIQGYYRSKPLKKEDLLTYLNSPKGQTVSS